jgi:hypothetical protein
LVEEIAMTVRKKQNTEPAPEPRGRFRRPSEQRKGVSEQSRKWLEENAEAIKEWNDWVEKNGFPLEKYRMS